MLQRLKLTVPIFQAPMAGVATPELAAAVSEAGGLGGLGLGASSVDAARAAIRETRALTERPFAVNFFCHPPAQPDPARDAAWCETLAPYFRRFSATPPEVLREIYTPLQENDAMQEMLVEEAPAVVSFHFGLPGLGLIEALQGRGCFLLASATSVAEARQIAALGCDAVIAQGWEAGGHRGAFAPDPIDEEMGTLALVRTLKAEAGLPVIAAGGIMDGAGIRAALTLGAEAVQMGTAFIGCPESFTEDGYRAALSSAQGTEMTSAISGRPARALRNRFTALGRGLQPGTIPSYPLAYDAGKALHAAAKASGERGFGAYWAGQGARLARAMPASDLMRLLARELDEARP